MLSLQKYYLFQRGQPEVGVKKDKSFRQEDTRKYINIFNEGSSPDDDCYKILRKHTLSEIEVTFIGVGSVSEEALFSSGFALSVS
jgi:hypothetical protein